ncbi:hypothetical protein BD310DRAFT_434084 [Dichomitus squalens]|uniref:Uncharacterized protein n=1 Tax=Dichomitus squalens TaxID=114155 RepID=A0A4Q9PWJ2_9APHY|nr:hypothetical protein BD310DRAFT_434084 [Dichomitus squalens]
MLEQRSQEYEGSSIDAPSPSFGKSLTCTRDIAPPLITLPLYPPASTYGRLTTTIGREQISDGNLTVNHCLEVRLMTVLDNLVIPWSAPQRVDVRRRWKRARHTMISRKRQRRKRIGRAVGGQGGRRALPAREAHPCGEEAQLSKRRRLRRRLSVRCQGIT